MNDISKDFRIFDDGVREKIIENTIENAFINLERAVVIFKKYVETALLKKSGFGYQNSYQGHYLEFSNYQKSNRKNKLLAVSLNQSVTNWKFLIETMVEKIKYAATEKYDFQQRSKTKRIANFDFSDYQDSDAGKEIGHCQT